jgi:hypothetical protein
MSVRGLTAMGVAAGLLAGCGFTPLYGDTGASGSLSRIAVTTQDDRLGYRLREQLEDALGPAPTKKKTWDHLSSVFANGAWPAPARSLSVAGAGRGGVSEEALAQTEARLLRRIDQLEERVIGLIEKL